MSLFLHFTVNPKPPVGFLDVPRCSMTGKEQTVGRYQQIESRWGYSGKCTISVNKINNLDNLIHRLKFINSEKAIELFKVLLNL